MEIEFVHDPATGWPFPVLMQDDNKKLSTWLSNTPHARALAEEAAKKINCSVEDCGLKKGSHCSGQCHGVFPNGESMEGWDG